MSAIQPALATASSSLLAALLLALPAHPQEVLNDRRRTWVVEVVERVKPAVVSISTNVQRQAWPYGFVEAEGPSGTGVVIYEDGFIITNYHVVKGATAIQVSFDKSDDEKVYPATLVSKREIEDLALLKIEGDGPFHTVTLCESDPILGESVIAIGNAFGHTHTVSTGIVSGLHRDIQTNENLHFENLIQTDASINPGNSGGPLLNINGELIGINNAMQGMAENIGFAIPVNRVRKVLSEQLLSLTEARAWLGFDVDENTFTVQKVVSGSPAEKAGVQVGDKLTTLAGHTLASVEGGDVRDVYRRVRLSVQPGADVQLELLHAGKKRNVAVAAWNQVDGILFERMGLALEKVRIGPGGGDPFLMVTSVLEQGPAARAGIKVGDVFTSFKKPRWLEGRWVQRIEDLAWLLSGLPAGTPLEFELYRDVDGDGRYFEMDAATDYSEKFKGSLTLR